MSLYLLYVLGVFGGIILLYVSMVFLLALYLRDNSIMDIAYGPAFMVAAWLTLIVTDTWSPLPVIIASCITLWALRLSIRILRKNIGKPEDARYFAWRSAWMEKGYTYFLIRSYLQIYLLQGSIIVIVALPFIVATAAGDALNVIVTGVGLFFYCVGLSIETIADIQLDRFIARKKLGLTDEKLMTDGLFNYSRRPNYFGEATLWWGLGIMALSVPYGLIAFLGPMLITYIVTKVTGPMLENMFLEKYPNEYREYMARTSYFFPLPPRA